MKKGFCKVCQFYNHASWLKPSFEKKVREGLSLRKLQQFCEGQGLKCDTQTLSKHIKECMNLEVKEQRELEKSIKKKGKDVIEKLKELFRPESNLLKPCEHLKRRRQFDLETEKVLEFCIDCGELIASYDPIRGEKQDFYKNMRIYEALKRRRK